MNDTCPTCGQSLPDDLPLHVDLEVGVVVANGVAVTLTAKEAELFSLVASTGARVASYEFLLEGLYLLDEPGNEIIKVMMCHMRKKLAKAGISIETVRGRGYRILHRKRVA